MSEGRLQSKCLGGTESTGYMDCIFILHVGHMCVIIRCTPVSGAALVRDVELIVAAQIACLGSKALWNSIGSNVKICVPCYTAGNK